MCQERVRRNLQLILAVCGIFISIYALFVETSKEKDTSYSALCDISDRISCSKVFTSRWGRGLGLLEKIIGRDHPLNVPNSVFGIIFYALVCLLELMSPGQLVAGLEVMGSVLSCASCVWLAYILVYVLEDICVVCVSTYIINAAILIGSVLRYIRISSALARRGKHD